jgi:hypothetical protein
LRYTTVLYVLLNIVPNLEFICNSGPTNCFSNISFNGLTHRRIFEEKGNADFWLAKFFPFSDGKCGSLTQFFPTQIAILGH